MRRISLLAGLSLFAFEVLPIAAAPAQTVALSGQVSSAEEGAMEGVLVSAKKAGSTITITVVSDKDGRFSFPAASSSPASTRSASAPSVRPRRGQAVEVAAQKITTHDIKLRKTEDLAAQLSNAEWINSIPGNDRVRAFLDCVGCHTLERVMRSTHTAEEFMKVTSRDAELRHQAFRNTRSFASRAADGGARRSRVQIYKATADFLATVNLSSKPQWISRSTRCPARAAAPRA